MEPQIQEVQRTPSRINTNQPNKLQHIPMHIIIKTVESKRENFKLKEMHDM